MGVYCMSSKIFKTIFRGEKNGKSLGENKMGVCIGRHSNIFNVLLSLCQPSYRGHLGFAYTSPIHTSSR